MHFDKKGWSINSKFFNQQVLGLSNNPKNYFKWGTKLPYQQTDSRLDIRELIRLPHAYPIEGIA